MRKSAKKPTDTRSEMEVKRKMLKQILFFVFYELAPFGFNYNVLCLSKYNFLPNYEFLLHISIPLKGIFPRR